MEGCPTGLLIDVCPETSPVRDTKTTFADLLSTLGISYTLSNGNCRVPELTGKATTCPDKSPSSLVSEEDYIINEVFDFKIPAFEELDIPQSETKDIGPNDEFDLPYEFPVLSSEPLSETLQWSMEVCKEAKKLSKRLSLLPDCITTETVKEVQTDSTVLFSRSTVECGSSISTSSVRNRTFKSFGSWKSSDGDDSVFETHLTVTGNSVIQVSEDKENTSPEFVPNPNVEVALTPEGVKKIAGPLQRRETFTYEKNTPKTSVGGNTSSQRRIFQNISRDANLKISTPKMPPRSNSFVKSQASPRISTFRKGESPQTRRSLSLDRSVNTSLSESIKTHQQLRPPRFKAGAPSPLLRKALVPPNLTSRQPPSSCNMGKGPIKVTPLGNGWDHQQNRSQICASSSKGTSKTLNSQSRGLQPKTQISQKIKRH